MKKFAIVILAAVIVTTFATLTFAQPAIPAPAKNDRVAVLEETTEVTENGQVVASDKRKTKLVIPNVAASGEADAAVKRLEGRLYGTKKKPGGTFGDLSRQMDAAVDKAVSNKAYAVEKELAKVPTALNAQTAAISASAEATRKLDFSNFWRTVWIILVIIIAGLILGWFVWYLLRRNKRCEEDRYRPIAQETAQVLTVVNAIAPTVEKTASGVEQVLTEVRAGFAEMRTGFEKLPERTAEAVRTLNPAPFEFTVEGNHVAYQSPVEGIREGYYLLLHVPEGATGDPATYHRDHEVTPGVARRNCQKTMRMYFEGKFNAPEYKLQKDLIEYLIRIGDIRVRKVN